MKKNDETKNNDKKRIYEKWLENEIENESLDGVCKFFRVRALEVVFFSRSILYSYECACVFLYKMLKYLFIIIFVLWSFCATISLVNKENK